MALGSVALSQGKRRSPREPDGAFGLRVKTQTGAPLSSRF